MDNLDKKIKKILPIFDKYIKDIKPIVADNQIIGLQGKDYKIKQINIAKTLKYININTNKIGSLRGFALAYYKLKYKKKINSELNMEERVLLRKYFFKQRLEIGSLINDQHKNTDFIKIDFNHMHLMQQTLELPVKKKQAKKKQGWEWGFYFVKHYTDPKLEPVLPVLDSGQTLFKTGYGEGVYGVEEIQYHLQMGGKVLEKHLVCAYNKMESCLKPLMNDFYKIPDRAIRKQLANQFCGNLGRKTGAYNYFLIKKSELSTLTYNINKTREYGEYLLIEANNVKTQNLSYENLSWALVIASRTRIEVHKLQVELESMGAKIFYINLDEIVVLKNSLTAEYLQINKKTYKKQVLKVKELENIKEQQWDLLYKRQNAGPENKRKAWYNIAH